MAADPITGWFISWICGKLADSTLKNLASNKDLRTELDKAVAEWAKALPKNMYVNPSAIFPDVCSISDTTKLPEYSNLQQLLVDNKLPAQEVWHKVFVESWLYVRKNVSKPQPFFTLTEQEAGAELKKLAEAAYNVCKQHEAIFKSHVIDQLDKIGKGIDYLTDGPKKPKRPGYPERTQNLPYSSIGNLFKGRDEILEGLRGELGGGKATAITQTQTIHGLGGIGKTRLAVEFGWWAWENEKFAAVLFVGAETPERLRASLAGLAGEKVLGLDGQKEEEQIAAVQQWLGSNKGWLMILDNADTEEMACEVEGLLPSLANGAVVITSRYTRWSAAVRPQELGLLDPQQARQFLLERTAGRRSETGEDESDAEKLAEELGYLPLALEQAGAYIVHNTMTFGDYLEKWRNEREDVLKWYNEREMKYPVSAAVTFQRTFEELSPAGRAVLRLAALLAPEPVPTAMFEEGSGIVAEAASVMAEELGKERGLKCDVEEAVGELAAYSMIDKEAKTFSMHRIVRDVIQLRIQERDRHGWIEMALRIVNGFAPTESGDVRTWPIWDVLRPHAETIVRAADQAKITEPTAWLMSVLGTYLHYKGLYDESERWKCRALAIDEAAFGKDHPDVARGLNNLARLYQDTNRLKEAEPLMKRVVDILENPGGQPLPNYAVALNNLALLYQATNRLKEAEPLYKRALAIDEAAFGRDHPDVATDLNNLAELYRTTSRYKQAEPLYKQVVNIFAKAYGEKHPNVATALNNLAQLYQDTNRLKEAEPLMNRALAIDEAAFGKDHPTVAIDLNNLAMLYRDTNRLKEAEPLMERALEIGETAFGKDHPKVAIRLNNLAMLYQATNRLNEAEPLYKRALEIDEAAFGKDHPDVARDLNNLAQLYQDTNRLREAEPLMQRALAIDEAAFGKDHPDVATDLNNLAGLYQDTNRLKEAEPLMQRALEIRERSLGPDHPDVALSLWSLAVLYHETNRIKEAEPLMQRALAIFESSLGTDHPDTKIIRRNLESLLE